MWTSWGSISYRLTNCWPRSQHLATSCLILKSQTHSLHNSVILCLLAAAAVVSHSVYLGRNICLGPEQTACFLGAFQFTCSGSQDHSHKPALRVSIRSRPLKVNFTRGNSFARAKHDLGSAVWSCLNLVFAQLPGLLKTSPRCLRCYFWLWQQVMAQHCNTFRCQQYQILTRDDGADLKPDGFWFLPPRGSPEIYSLSRALLCVTLSRCHFWCLLLDNTRILTPLIPPLHCVQLPIPLFLASSISSLTGGHHLPSL